ncbi:large ribosomal subunit protein uL18c isoform X2 [Primulina huaijiensis]|uniref:large ribosomal subunit protein uL18c isoform X2 n=1 Tax=Primulina huaijiensis TaxID=1492673 RepID=UPI003CC74C2B
MALDTLTAALRLNACGYFGTGLRSSNILPMQSANLIVKPLVVEAKANTRTESDKILNRRRRKKLYAMLVDDQNKKCLFYGSTLQKSIRSNTACTTIEAAERVGEELIKACVDLNINEISIYDRNGLARGERMQAFEIAIARHGFLPR